MCVPVKYVGSVSPELKAALVAGLKVGAAATMDPVYYHHAKWWKESLAVVAGAAYYLAFFAPVSWNKAHVVLMAALN